VEEVASWFIITKLSAFLWSLLGWSSWVSQLNGISFTGLSFCDQCEVKVGRLSNWTTRSSINVFIEVIVSAGPCSLWAISRRSWLHDAFTIIWVVNEEVTVTFSVTCRSA
jgi:hypothetical protein